jgi:hypothetical protein
MYTWISTIIFFQRMIIEDDMPDYMIFATYAFSVVLVIGIVLYLRPRFIAEGFTTVAIEGEVMPRCLTRDPDSQALLAQLYNKAAPNTPAGEAYAEFKLILQKLLCIDADVTGMGAGAYSTYQLPYVTAHDIEPAANFVGRCVRNATRERDVFMVLEKFESRGNVLLKTICSGDSAAANTYSAAFNRIVKRIGANITSRCLSEKAIMDVPASPRDPGYYIPNDVENLQEYTLFGGSPQYL